MIQETLQQPYDRSRWTALLAEVFPNVSIYEKPQRSDEAGPAFVRDFLQLGHVRLEDGKNLAIFEVKVSGKIDLSRNRVALRDFVARQINLGTTHGVLCVFNSSEPTYRFTFVCKETTLDEAGQITTTETNPRRFTYILGPGETRRTAAERFKELAARRDHAGMKEIIEAFSVERLNKEFFDSYKRHYQAFVDNIILSDAPSRLFGIAAIPGSEEFPAACKPVRDWVKRMLGRIVFLHFLQKKGWMGVPADARKWVGGDPKFLQSLFEGCPKKDRFHSTRLAKLFTEALNRPDRSGDIFDITGTRVPYLNGGLFEDGPRALAKLDVPAPLFAGLLDFLGTYNFTIDENDPDENEVGIDPEMLGHIFENLLEDNKDKGAFYTPKNAVQYMCQESLIRFFASRFGDRDEIRRLVRLKDPGDRDDPDNWIRQNARTIEAALDAIKVCDPAIGSGAFPIGLLQEIFWIKLTLDWTLDPAETKRKIIQNSIYGVDLDPGAVEIARLRFWLALVVDEKEPRPLPNLEFSIFCADSLVEYVRGEPVNLGKLTSDDRTRPIVERLIAAKHDFFQAERVPAKRKALAAVYSSLAELAHYEFSWLKTEQGLFGDAARAAQLDHAGKEIGFVLRQLAGMGKLNAAEQDATLDRIRAWFHDPAKPTFLWELHFGEVFAQGGFDIVIANPPYVSAMDHKKSAGEEYRNAVKRRFSVATGAWDLYIPFFQLGANILKSSGTLCLICPNKYLSASYALGLRDFLHTRLSLQALTDVSRVKIFETASVYPVITFLSNRPMLAENLLVVLTPPAECPSSHHVWSYSSNTLDSSVLGLLPDLIWGFLLSPTITLLTRVLGRCGRLDSVAEVNATTTAAEADAYGGMLSENTRGSWRVVNTGTIDPYQSLWGARSLTHQRRSFEQPTLMKVGGAISFNRTKLYNSPKLIFAKMALRFEGFVDSDGSYAALNSNCVHSPRDGWNLESLAAILHSKCIHHVYAQYFDALRMAGGYLPFQSPQARVIPIPPATHTDKERLSQLAKACAAAAQLGDRPTLTVHQAEIDEIVYRLFALTPEEIALIESRLPAR